MNQKMNAAINREETGIYFPYLTKIGKYWELFGLKQVKYDK
jgi:hypothetical protein